MAAERPPQGGQWKPTAPQPKPTAPQKPSAPAPSGNASQPMQAASGSPMSKYTWALALVQALGGTPTPAIVNLIVAWIDKEGTSAAWNPLAITGHASGSTQFNSVGVQNFTSFQQGVQATAQFLQNGRYDDIVNAIRLGNPNVAFGHLNEFNTWGGSSSYGSSLVGIYRTVSGDKTAGAGALLAAGGQAGDGAGGATPNASAAQTWILMNDPSLDWALGIPELQGILSKADVSTSAGIANLQAALQGSDYYKSHSTYLRNWEIEQQTDPATAQRDLQAAEASLRSLAASLGLQLSDSSLAGLALSEKQFGWQPGGPEEHQALLAASAFSQSGTLGAIGDGAVQARQLFAQYGIKLSDQQAQQYGLQINTADSPSDALENLRPIAISQAKGLFPNLAAQLDSGTTVAQIFSPYQSAAATLLEVDPSQVDLTNPLYNRALMGDNHSGQMSLDQWQSTVMTDPRYGWDRTQNARSAAVNLTQQLGQTFGVSA